MNKRGGKSSKVLASAMNSLDLALTSPKKNRKPSRMLSQDHKASRSKIKRNERLFYL
jgi:hypothetical protein